MTVGDWISLVVAIWEPAMRWLSGLAQTDWYRYLAAAVVGAAITLWVSYWLRKRELWSEGARLTLAFDGNSEYATPSCQEGIAYYFWYCVPGISVDWDNRQITRTRGYLMLFMSFGRPTHTNYSKVNVIGGGFHCEIMGTHPFGTVVRIMGDVSGRTIDVRFSKAPISIN